MKKLFSGASALLLACFVTVSNSIAALTTEQQAAVDSIDTMITDYSAWAWAAVLTIVGFTIGIKLFKKFTGKAT